MKSAKILFAAFILLASLREAFYAYKQTGDKWFSIIILTISIILCGLLLRSAFKPKKLVLQENRYKIYLWNFLKIISIIGIIGFVINIGSPQSYEHLITIKGLRIPLDNCIAGNIRMIKEIDKRKEYCECLAQKLTENDTIISDYKQLLSNGQFATIMKELKQQDRLISVGIENCFVQINSVEWTKQLKESIKIEYLNQLKESDFEMTNNIEEYCDCVIEKLIKFPANEVMSGEFSETEEWVKIDSTCQEESKH